MSRSISLADVGVKLLRLDQPPGSRLLAPDCQVQLAQRAAVGQWLARLLQPQQRHEDLCGIGQGHHVTDRCASQRVGHRNADRHS
jgi:hypothetical protein